MTLCGFIAFFSAVFGLWPIWGFLTPIYLAVLFMGYTMTLVFMPSGICGMLLFWIVTIGIAVATHFIHHL